MIVARRSKTPGPARRSLIRPLGLTRCTVEHVGLVLEGAAVAAMDDGRIIELKAGMLFYVPGEPHDSWVVGNERYVSLHFLGAEGYATSRPTDPVSFRRRP